MAVSRRTAERRDALYSKESWRKLARLCEKILKDSGPDRDTFHDLAVAYMRLGEVRAARENAAKVLMEEHGSANLDVLPRRIRETFFTEPAKGEHARRNRHYEVVAEVFLEMEDDKPAELILKALRDVKYPSPDGLYLLADLYLIQGRAEEAAEMLASMPDEFHDRWDVFVEYLRAMLADAPDSFDFARRLSEKLDSGGTLEIAADAFVKKIKRRERTEVNLSFLIFAAIALSDFVEAEKLYDELIKVNAMVAERFRELLPKSDSPSPKAPARDKADEDQGKMALVYGFRNQAHIKPLEGHVIRIGRRHDNDIPILAAGVSRHHCMIEEKDGEYTLIDLESRNGTVLQGKPVERAQIFPGDAFIVGEVIFFFVPMPRADAYRNRLISVPAQPAGRVPEIPGTEFEIVVQPEREPETLGNGADYEDETLTGRITADEVRARMAEEADEDAEAEDAGSDTAGTAEIKLKPDFVVDEIGPTCLKAKMKGNEYEMEVAVSEDEMRAYLSIMVDKRGIDVTAEAVRLLLVRNGILLNPDNEVLDDILKWVSGTGLSVSWAKIAEGVEPEHGVDGGVDWIVEPADAESEGEAYVVSPGQTIATVHPPTPGKPGINVFGQEVPARPGKQIDFEFSDSLATADAGQEIYTLRGGKLVVVVNEIRIESEEDEVLSAGKMKFGEALEVQEDVSGDIHLTAEKGITVGGMIEKAQVESGEQIEVKGGVSGQKKGWLKAETRIQSKFLHGVTARAHSDVVVTSEIINSQVMALEKIELLGGRVLGGELNALKRIVVPIAGSRMSVRTRLTIGRGEPFGNLMKEIDSQIAAARNQIVRLNREINAFESQRRERGILTSQEEDLLEEYEERVGAARQERDTLGAEKKKLENLSRDSRAGEIIIKEKAYPGVILQIGPYSTEIKRVLDGPVIIMADRRSKQLVIQQM
ncbi:MAG: FapA family protein [Planctomycetota bacterium]|jgi:uncharacterized protein (DUF342 family)/pSer/pThr/pTyr-binding forkhead associated (FHA) protein